MRYFQLALLCFLCVAKSYSQAGTRSYHTIVVEITKEKKPKKISTKVELSSPPFPGGDSSWIKSLEDSLNRSISFKNRAKAGKYIFSIRFLIEKDGSMTDIRCIKDPGYGMCQQVITALRKKYGTKWGPRIGPNDKVRQYHSTLITPMDE